MTNLTNPTLNVAIAGWKSVAGKMVLTYAYGIVAPAYKLKRKYR